MVLFDVRDIQSAVTNLLSPLTGVGEALTFTRNKGEYNAQTGDIVANTIVTYTSVGYPKEVTEQEINNLDVLIGDLKLTISPPATQIPQINDSVQCSFGVYRVMNVQPTAVNGQILIYKLVVRI